MTWKDRLSVLSVLIAVYLVVSVAPAGAAEQLVVASQHTTDTELNNAKELTNVTVEGTGDSASVVLQEQRRTIDDVEDGDVSEYTFSSSGDGLNYDFSAQSTDPNTGTYGINQQLEASGGAASRTEKRTINLNVRPSGRANLSLAHKLYSYQDEDSSDATAELLVNVSLTDGSTETLTYRLASVLSGQSSNPSSLFFVVSTHNTETWDTFSRSINADLSNNGYANATQINSYSFEVSVPGEGGTTDIIRMRYDDLEINTLDVTGTYRSQDHDVSSADQAAVNLTLQNASATVTVTGEPSGTVLNQTTFTTSGNHTVELLSSADDKVEINVTFDDTGGNWHAELHDESILFVDQSPELDESSATPDGEQLTEQTVDLEIDVSDREFGSTQGESVDVEFFVDGSSVGTDTLSSNGTASLSVTETDGGDHTWSVEATDDYGLTTTSQDFTFGVPGNITIYNETNPTEIVDNTEVTLTYFGSGEDVLSNTTTDGTINMTNLDASEKYVLQLQADGYETRTVILDGIYQQQSVYLLPDSATSVESRFTLSDKTGQFASSESFLRIQKPITKNGNTTYKTVAGGSFGPAGVTTTLETEQRYRLIVENNDGDTRVVGAYTPVTSETVELVIGEISYDLAEGETYGWNATYKNDTGTAQITFGFSDADKETDSIDLVIYEKGDKSNKIVDTTFTAGPYGNLSFTKILSASQANQTWVVEFEGQRDGETISGSAIVGESRGPTGIPLDPVHKWGLAVGGLFVVAGIGANIDPAIGAIVTTIIGGLLTWFGWMPPEVGLGAVALALIASVLYAIRFRGGGV